MNIPTSRVLRVGTVVVVLALLAGAIAVFWPGADTKRLVAYFPRAVGLYEGNDVSVLGVPVGKVTAVEPEGTKVRVEMTYEAGRKVPADAKAVVVSPTLVSDRYVQLAPAYTGGAVLDDGATIPQPRTATPVELDRVYGALNDLSKALGPKGVNKKGSLSRLLKVSANNLEGEGKNIHKTVRNLSNATDTLADGSDDLFSTVRNLQQFTTTLANSDQQVKAFNSNLADVSDQLAGERDELRAALQHLSTSLKDVKRFVRVNKGEVATNVDDLTQVSKVLVKEKKALARSLNMAPLALSNLALAYNPTGGTLDTRMDIQQIQNPAMYICSLVYSLGVSPKQCEPILAPLNALRREHLPLGIDPSFLTKLTHATQRQRYGGGDPGSGGGDAGQQNAKRRTSGQGDGSSGDGDGSTGGGGTTSGERSAPRPSLLPDSSLEKMLTPGGEGS